MWNVTKHVGLVVVGVVIVATAVAAVFIAPGPAQASGGVTEWHTLHLDEVEPCYGPPYNCELIIVRPGR
jgi:hypothetical protein